LPFYIEALATRIGTPSLVVCLDSGCGDWERMWSTTSLRGLVGGNLIVETIKEGVHSGDASGIVPSSFRVLRKVLSRLEDEDTGRIRDPFFHVEIPKQRIEQAHLAAQVLGDAVWSKFPWHTGCVPMAKDQTELLLNRTWRPALSITGARGFPDLDAAGNTLRPLSAVKISLRIPPTLEPKAALARLKELLEQDPPYGARVRFEGEKASTGWHAPELAPWLEAASQRASRAAFGHDSVCMGEGGSIPFMGMLGRRYPQAQFLITGVLGPHSNAHGPNEFLDIPTGRKLTACVAQVIADHAMRS
jgi:acetylornithine deacetylase/succinyl-diaminopimelate desuccinylase-like protein